LLLRQGHSEAAEKLYCEALSVAKEQEAKLWELRAAVSLARLRRDQHGHAEVRDLLAPVYDWFREGFETLDLRGQKHSSTNWRERATGMCRNPHQSPLPA
jgi:predicted ATPase